MRTFPIALAAALALPSVASGQETAGKVTPLFAEDSVLEVTITGPIKQIVRKAKRSTDAYPATLATAGETLPIELSARGLSRRQKSCRFPPLRVKFPETKADGSLFRKQGSIKLVTHCLTRSSAEQLVLREYAAYRLFNVATPKSHMVRLAQITYVDEGEVVDRKLGFFIEDTDDTARRLGMEEVDVDRISPRSLDRQDAARYALFQYMIGNTDWAMIVGPKPGDCCHNSKLLQAKEPGSTGMTPVPYDFDSSGIVDAPYAEVNETLGIRDVKQRKYRGFCQFNDLMPSLAARFRAQRTDFESAIAAIPRLDAENRAQVRDYLASFFADIADDAALQKNLLDDCR